VRDELLVNKNESASLKQDLNSVQHKNNTLTEALERVATELKKREEIYKGKLQTLMQEKKFSKH